MPMLSTEPRDRPDPPQADVHPAVEEDQHKRDGHDPVDRADRRRGHRREHTRDQRGPQQEEGRGRDPDPLADAAGRDRQGQHTSDDEQNPRIRLDVLHHGRRSCPVRRRGERSTGIEVRTGRRRSHRDPSTRR